jgi:hypothetical protein
MRPMCVNGRVHIPSDVPASVLFLMPCLIFWYCDLQHRWESRNFRGVGGYLRVISFQMRSCSVLSIIKLRHFMPSCFTFACAVQLVFGLRMLTEDVRQATSMSRAELQSEAWAGVCLFAEKCGFCHVFVDQTHLYFCLLTLAIH